MIYLCKCGCGKETPLATRNRYELEGYVKGQPVPFLVGHRIRGLRGSAHFNFKGEAAGYKAMHLRVSRLRGRAIYCVNDPTHISSRYEWANLSGKYGDPSDYISLCKPCHVNLDDINGQRVKTLGEKRLKEIAKKGWETRRRKTSLEASSGASPAEGGVAMS